MVESVIPTGEEFTANDLMRSLEAIDPGRVWPKTSILRHITKLRELKIVRRVKRHQVNQSAVYVRDDGAEEEQQPMRDVVQAVVVKPMRTAEILVAIQETGWQTKMSKDCFQTYVKATLRKCGYRETGGKWTLGARSARR